MRTITILLAIVVLHSNAAPSNNPKEKPSIMIGIKRSASSTSTPVSTEAPEITSTTSKTTVTKKPYSEKFVKVPEKPLSYEKKPAKMSEIAKKSVVSETRADSTDEVIVPQIDGVSDQAAGSVDVPDVADVQVNQTDSVDYENKSNRTYDSTTDVYDNSQHGRENYRVHLKGFTFLVAPSETILGAAMLMSGLGEKENAVNGMKNVESKMMQQKASFAKLMQILHVFQDEKTENQKQRK